MLLQRALCTALVGFSLACSDSRESGPGPAPSPFRKVTLDDSPGEPMGLAVLPDGRVLHTSRDGTVWLHQQDGTRSAAARLSVYTHDEEGLQGIAIDAEFGQNRWVYLYYSPLQDNPVDDPATLDLDEAEAPLSGLPETWSAFQGVVRLSRFVLEQEQLQLSSEQVLLEVPVDRGSCCHVAGQIDFDGAGNLYLSTGDDTNPFVSAGYTPIDEGPGQNPALDAQRSAANTNDLRGKLLRIHVEADGSYTIPEGNLFAPGTPQTRPEIYAMGLRNPFRFSVNRESGHVYLGDHSPDARESNPLRGPAGLGKWVIIRAAANYGWPYCADAESPYVDFDFASQQSGSAFDCGNPSNDSPRNTGQRELPPVAAADLTYSYGASARFPELGSGGVSPMAGPAYSYVEDLSAVRWPMQYAGAPLFYDWARDLVRLMRLSSEGGLERIEPVAPGFQLDNPIDLEFGPDGALYVLEYGDGYYSANPEARLLRVEYVGGAAP
jgi:glucose/arabinose dehydrogenase